MVVSGLTASSPEAHRSTARDALGRVRVAVVHEVVQRAEHEIEQVDVVAHVAGQQPAGQRERPRHLARRRPRFVEHRTHTRTAASAVTSPAVTAAPINTPGMPAPGCVPPPTW